MSNKPHRVVLGVHAFQRLARLLNDHAVECAENEGWPIPADAEPPPRAMACHGVLQRVVAPCRQHARRAWQFWGRRSESQCYTKDNGGIPRAAAEAAS